VLRITDPSQKVTGHDLTNPRYAAQVFHCLAKLWCLPPVAKISRLP
jgi:hypothetical protein